MEVAFEGGLEKMLIRCVSVSASASARADKICESRVQYDIDNATFYNKIQHHGQFPHDRTRFVRRSPHTTMHRLNTIQIHGRSHVIFRTIFGVLGCFRIDYIVDQNGGHHGDGGFLFENFHTKIG